MKFSQHHHTENLEDLRRRIVNEVDGLYAKRQE
jgi:hypothetical protein